MLMIFVSPLMVGCLTVRAVFPAWLFTARANEFVQLFFWGDQVGIGVLYLIKPKVGDFGEAWV